MDALPFEASSDAITEIVRLRRLLSAEKDRLVTTLFYTLRSAGYEQPHFMVVGYSPEDTEDFTEVRVLDWSLFVTSRAMEQLKGKRLVVKKVSLDSAEYGVLVAVNLETN